MKISGAARVTAVLVGLVASQISCTTENGHGIGPIPALHVANAVGNPRHGGLPRGRHEASRVVADEGHAQPLGMIECRGGRPSFHAESTLVDRKLHVADHLHTVREFQQVHAALERAVRTVRRHSRREHRH